MSDALGGGGLSERIRVPKTSEIVADKFRARIVRGELGEGDKLPPEGQLLETLGISRPTLREAFRILEAEGLISVVRGSRTGAVVHRPSVDLVSRYAGYVLESQGATISDLYQSRLAIEPTVVRWLALDGGTKSTGELRKLIVDMEAMLKDGQHGRFIDACEVFHQTLVAATNLKTLTFLSRMLFNLASKHQREFQVRNTRSAEARDKSHMAGLKSYQKLVDLIERGEVEDAVQHWRLHLNNANSTWTGEGEGVRVVESL